ncbi:MAG TPA: HD domain-containing phosphohydrolase [Solirubrobacteraceae bacterium]|nr:HD domain-containing phosphohydrolase [Solirubrobacteraceae bacterium]
MQQTLSNVFNRATDALRRGVAVACNGELDMETGLRTRACLHADLARLNGVPARVELLALHADDGLDDVMLSARDADLQRRVGDALRAVTEPHGARAYRLDANLYAFLGPIEGGALSPAAAAHRALARLSERLASGAVRGEARIPDEAADGDGALAIAHERLQTRARWQRPSSERAVRDVLLQILSERRAGGSAAVLPRVAAHAIGVGRRLGLALGELDDIVRAAELQDIGMLAVPEAVLRKRGSLEPEEWAQIRRHPVVGERIVGAAPALAPVARLVRSSYERFDGTGYPDGIRGERIPLGSRVIAVCVAYDAMTSPRPYREALPAATAFEELCRCAGHQFDPVVVSAFCAEMDQLDPEAVTAAA